MHGEYGLSCMGFGAILGKGYETQGQNYVALLLGNEISAGFNYRNLILAMLWFKLIT